jgi:hypothetical protein
MGSPGCARPASSNIASNGRSTNLFVLPAAARAVVAIFVENNRPLTGR